MKLFPQMKSRDLQHRPGLAVHQRGLHRAAKERRDQDQHGRQGPWRDNVFVERIWKSIKYEEVYLHAYASVSEARARIAKYIEFYNSMRPHSSLKALTPDQVYFNRLPESMAA